MSCWFRYHLSGCLLSIDGDWCCCRYSSRSGKRLAERALALAEGGGASEQRGLAIALHNLAYAYRHLGRVRDSEPLMEAIERVEQKVPNMSRRFPRNFSPVVSM